MVAALIAIGFGLVALIAIFLWFDGALERFHDRIAFDGRTMNPTPVALTIADTRLLIPANMIRFANERRPRAIERADLLLHWPELDGFSEKTAESFRANEAVAPLIFVTITGRDTDSDTTGWLNKIYTRYFSDDAWAGPNGLVGVKLTADSGYDGEELFFQPEATIPFVARCTADGNPEMPSTCQREVLIGDRLMLRYRFNRTLLGKWDEIDPALKARVTAMIKE